MNPPTPQLEHDASASPANCSQCARILNVLREAGEGTWVTMPALARAASEAGQGTGICVSRRIYDLRKRIAKDNQTIEQRDQWTDGVRHSFYRLAPLVPAQPSNASTLQP